MSVLPDAWSAVIDAVIAPPVAWRSPAEIAEAIGRPEGETTDTLSELDAAGWLVVWEAEGGPLVTLSALAARKLGVRLVEVGEAESPRWARDGDPDPPAHRPKHVCRSARSASLEFVLDPAATPDLLAERAEAIEAVEPSPDGTRRVADPRPTRLVGLGLTPWPGPRADLSLICPACGDRMLAPQMYCLYCDRWGLDRPGDSEGNSADAPPRVPPSHRSAPAEAVDAERLRARRKAKRRGRHRADKAETAPTADARPTQAQAPSGLVPLSSPPPGKTSAKAAR